MDGWGWAVAVSMLAQRLRGWSSVGTALVGRLRLLGWWTKDIYLTAEVRCLSSVGMIIAHHYGSVLEILDTRQVQDVGPLLVWCGPDVEDDGPASPQHWVAYASRTCWKISSQQTWSVGPVLFWCWAGVADGGPALNRHWVSVSSLLVYLLFSCMLYNGSRTTFRPMQVYIRPVPCGVYTRIFYFKRTLSLAFCWFRVGPELATLTQPWTGGGQEMWAVCPRLGQCWIGVRLLVRRPASQKAH